MGETGRGRATFRRLSGGGGAGSGCWQHAPWAMPRHPKRAPSRFLEDLVDFWESSKISEFPI